MRKCLVDAGPLIELTKKHSDVPMDFADASLVVISDIENIKNIITIDSDFYVYRNIRKEWFVNLFKIDNI